jgi:hypothetical protein
MVTTYRPKLAQSRTQHIPRDFALRPHEISPVPSVPHFLLFLPFLPFPTPPMASSSENTAPPTEEPHAPPQPPNPSQVEAEEPQTLERAQDLFDQGSKAIEDGDFVEAVDCLSRALEIRSGLPTFRSPTHRFLSPHLVRPRVLVQAKEVHFGSSTVRCVVDLLET